MIPALLATVAVGFASAFIPAIPIEPYVVGLVATTDQHPVPVGLAAAVGQTAGKLLIFLAVRGLIRAPWIKRWTSRRAPAAPLDEADVGVSPPRVQSKAVGVSPPRVQSKAVGVSPPRVQSKAARRTFRTWTARLVALLDRPGLQAPIVLLSAAVGIPPLLLVSAYAGRTRMTTGLFAAVCLTGRSIRFVVLAYAPQLIIG
jgi:membrane protein YqaA with SNARE-associated domain